MTVNSGRITKEEADAHIQAFVDDMKDENGNMRFSPLITMEYGANFPFLADMNHVEDRGFGVKVFSDGSWRRFTRQESVESVAMNLARFLTAGAEGTSPYPYWYWDLIREAE